MPFAKTCSGQTQVDLNQRSVFAAGLGCKWAPKLSAAWAGGIAGREVIGE